MRSGGAGDGFGPAGSKSDVAIVPGSISVDDLPDQNQVVVRFADTLPDDSGDLPDFTVIVPDGWVRLEPGE